MVRALASGAVLFALLVAAPGAYARPAIIDVCGSNLCRVDPATGRSKPLTRDGKGGRGPVYRSPSLSRDGKRLAFTFGNTLYVADAKARHRRRLAPTVAIAYMAPDGRQVAYSKSINEIIDPGFFPCCHPPIFGLIPYLFRVPAAGGRPTTVSRSVVTAGWLGGRLMRDDLPSADEPSLICLLASNDDYHCLRPVARDPTRDVSGPAGSPDGRTVAAVAAEHSTDPSAVQRFSGAIVLFDAASGAPLRELTHGPDDSNPAFSPDGKRVAFTRGRTIYVVPAAGGRARKLHRGTNPTWG
jgi:hypothetical protein